jgi:hypothetical protein
MPIQFSQIQLLDFWGALVDISHSPPNQPLFVSDTRFFMAPWSRWRLSTKLQPHPRARSPVLANPVTKKLNHKRFHVASALGRDAESVKTDASDNLVCD